MTVTVRTRRARGALGGAVGFLTVLGPASAPSPSSLGFFPVVGAAVGGGLGGLWLAASAAFPRLAAAGVVVAADVAVTGALHFDGLADAADGLVPPLSRRRRLEVMRDPAVGAFGATAVATALVLRAGALASVAPSALLLAGLWAASRTWMAVTAAGMPYARADGGLVSAFLRGAGGGEDDPSTTGGSESGQGESGQGESGRGESGPADGGADEGRAPDGGADRGRPDEAEVGERLGLRREGSSAKRPAPLGIAILGLAIAGALAAAWRPVAGPVAVAAGSAGAWAVVLLAWRRLGGVTGDVLGALGVVCETLGLLVATARW